VTLRPLKRGSLIGIAAPAGPFDRRRFRKGVLNLQRAGFRTRNHSDIFSRDRYLAGSDSRRSRELNDLLADPKVEAVLFARGGFGTQRLLPTLKRFRPKVIVGLSDLTALLATLWKKYRLPTLYGPMIATQLIHPATTRRLTRILTTRGALERQLLVAKRVFQPGNARGRLVGGCLSLIVSLIGTPWDLETAGSILFLEDVDEPPYKIDRLMTQMEQAGKLKGVKGIVFGTFRLRKNHFPREIEKVLSERLKDFRGPVLWGLRFGHCPNPLILPIGGIGRIRKNRLVIERGIFS